MKHPKIILNSYDLKPNKNLGQNFIIDFSVAEKIVSESGLNPHNTVLEIGAGLGMLTLAISKKVKKVFAIETDRKLIPILIEKKEKNVEVICENIMGFDFDKLIKNNDKIVIMGNLPYYIASQIIIKIIKKRDVIKKAVLMTQKEMADRIVAKIGTKSYGRLSVALAYCADVKKIADFTPNCFFPKPKVSSSVILIDFNKERTKNEKLFFEVVKSAFSKRRKTIKNALIMGELKLEKKRVENIFDKLNINEKRRAETFSVEEFIKIKDELTLFL